MRASPADVVAEHSSQGQRLLVTAESVWRRGTDHMQKSQKLEVRAEAAPQVPHSSSERGSSLACPEGPQKGPFGTLRPALPSQPPPPC